jgi:hypothetical protein
VHECVRDQLDRPLGLLEELSGELLGGESLRAEPHGRALLHPLHEALEGGALGKGRELLCDPVGEEFLQRQGGHGAVLEEGPQIPSTIGHGGLGGESLEELGVEPFISQPIGGAGRKVEAVLQDPRRRQYATPLIRMHRQIRITVLQGLQEGDRRELPQPPPPPQDGKEGLRNQPAIPGAQLVVSGTVFVETTVRRTLPP